MLEKPKLIIKVSSVVGRNHDCKIYSKIKEGQLSGAWFLTHPMRSLEILRGIKSKSVLEPVGSPNRCLSCFPISKKQLGVLLLPPG